MGETRDYETIRKMKESAVEIDSKSEGYVMKSEYDALLRLRAYNEMGKSVYMNINGTIVYSCDVTTLNSGCKVYKGRTWDESKKKMSKLNEAKEKAFIQLDKKTIINEQEINYIKKDGMKLVFCTSSGNYETYSSFNKIESLLPDNFVRCHKSYIANTDTIQNINMNNNTVLFNNDLSCDIGPKYKNNLMEVFKHGNISNNLDSINNGE